MSWHLAGMLVLVAAGLPLVWRTVRAAFRGQFATDIVASLSVITATVLAQPVPGLVIILMQRGGEWLERDGSCHYLTVTCPFIPSSACGSHWK